MIEGTVPPLWGLFIGFGLLAIGIAMAAGPIERLCEMHEHHKRERQKKRRSHVNLPVKATFKINVPGKPAETLPAFQVAITLPEEVVGLAMAALAAGNTVEITRMVGLPVDSAHGLTERGKA